MILAADLGSTNFKAAVFAPDGRRLGEAAEPVPYEIHTSTRAELSPAAVTETFDRVLAGALGAAGVGATDVDRLTLASQAQTFCLCDRDGTALGPFTGWSDQRAGDEAAELQSVLGADYHATSGWPCPLAGQLAAQAFWAMRHNGAARRANFVTLPSYLALRVGAPFVIDRNLAAMTGLYDIPGRAWWPAALDATGLRPDQLGTLVDPGQAVPTVNGAAGGMRCGVAPHAVVLAGNDHTSAAAGCGCSPRRSVLTIGTAGVFYRRPASGGYGPFSPDGVWGPYPGGGCYELRFVADACSALDWADHLLFGKIDSAAFVSASREARTAGEVRFDPARWGSPDAWTGAGTRGQKALAVLEGIASALRDLAPENIDSDGEILVMGGGSRLDFWVQMLADKFGCRLLRTHCDSLTGAAVLAGCSPGMEQAESTEFFPAEAPS
jgi:sugar (pentulose or hexulose) kinase